MWQKTAGVCLGLGAVALVLPTENSVKKTAYKQFYGKKHYKSKLNPTKLSEVQRVEASLRRFRADLAAPENHISGAVLIRPSGNPLPLDEKLAQWLSDNISDASVEILSEPPLKIDVSGDLAYTCHTERAKFKYRGNENDDKCVWTTVFKKQNDEWKVCHCQRSVGEVK